MHASIVPAFIEAKGGQAYTRFHGKNRENWFKRNVTAAERFKYLDSERELGSLAEGLGTLEKKGVKRAFAVFNNCYQNFGFMNATTMNTILRDQGYWKISLRLVTAIQSSARGEPEVVNCKTQPLSLFSVFREAPARSGRQRILRPFRAKQR